MGQDHAADHFWLDVLDDRVARDEIKGFVAELQGFVQVGHENPVRNLRVKRAGGFDVLLYRVYAYYVVTV